MGDENGSTTSSKRKWSPCTWRYAIEDSQADQLPHKARPWPRAECKDARSGYDCSELLDHPHRHRHRQTSVNPNRQPPGTYGLHHRAAALLLKKAQTQALAPAPLATEPQDPIVSCNNDSGGGAVHGGSPPKNNGPDINVVSVDRNHNKAPRGKVAKLPTALKQLSSTSEENEHCGRCHYYSPSSDADSRSKREMSPTELYFCDICSGRTAMTEIPAV